jgi:hypothetical protein
MASLSINTLRRMSICKSQAWKDTQRILKRSGLVYRGERFERRGHIHSLVAEERFISALPHFSFIHKLINTFNL